MKVIIVNIEDAQSLDDTLMSLVNVNAVKWGFITSIDGTKAAFHLDNRVCDYLCANYTEVEIEQTNEFWFDQTDLIDG